jgi:hypothetical protein
MKKHLLLLLVIFAALGLTLLLTYPFHKQDSSMKKILHLKSNLPHFVGREKYLLMLRKELLYSGKKYRNSVKVQLLWGKGGSGKSELAIEFANRYLSKFSLIWSFQCNTPQHLNQGYRNLAEALGILNPQDSPEEIQLKVHAFFGKFNIETPLASDL